MVTPTIQQMARTADPYFAGEEEVGGYDAFGYSLPGTGYMMASQAEAEANYYGAEAHVEAQDLDLSAGSQ